MDPQAQDSGQLPLSLVADVLGIIATIPIVIGSVLPWVSADVIIFHISKNGMDGDGKITLPASIVALTAFLILTLAVRSRTISYCIHGIAFAVGALAISTAVIDGRDIANKVSTDSIGIGIYLIGIGGIALVICMAANLINKNSTMLSTPRQQRLSVYEHVDQVQELHWEHAPVVLRCNYHLHSKEQSPPCQEPGQYIFWVDNWGSRTPPRALPMRVKSRVE